MRVILFLCLALAACGQPDQSPSPEALDGEPTVDAQKPMLEGQLAPESQKARYLACQDRMAEFAELAGDQRNLLRTQPLISPSAFLRLDAADQERFIELSACLGAGGQIGERRVTILSETTGRELNVSTARNNQDW